MSVEYGTWTVNGVSPSAITGVTVDFPKITLKCEALSEENGGSFADPLAEILYFNGLACWKVEEIELINGGTFLWGDRKHDLILISDGTHTYHGLVENVGFEIDQYSNEMMPYTIDIVLELPSDPADITDSLPFDATYFDPSVFLAG